MAVTAKFLADFSSFEQAVGRAEVKLTDWSKEILRVDKDLTKMSSAFSGSKLLQEATLAAKGVDAIGGASKLTAKEQASVNALVTEAIAKYAALGQQAPDDIKKLQLETARLEPPLTMAQKAAGLLSSTFGQFTAANLVSNAVSTITAKVGEFVAVGVKLPAVQASFQRLSTGVHQNSVELLSSMDKAARGLVSDFDLMQSANKAMLLGLPVTSKEMGEITKAAITMGRAMGIDATKSVNDFVEAIGKGSPEILNNFGIIVKAEDAYKKFADANGKTVEAMTAAEKQLAVYSDAMEKARAKTAELGDQTKTLGEIVDTAWTKVGNVISHVTADLNVGLGGAVSSGKNFVQFLVDASSVGPGLAIQLARTRAEMESMGKAARDTNLPIERTVDVLGDYRDHLASLQGKVSGLSDEQQKLILRAAALGESSGDIAKAMGIELNAVSLTIKAHEQAGEAVKKHAAEFAALNAQLGLNRELGGQALTAINALNSSFFAVGFHKGNGLVDQFITLARESDTLNYALATTNEELDDLARSFDFAQAITATNIELDALADGLKKAGLQAHGFEAGAKGMFKGIQSGFHDLVDGMTGKNGVAGFMNNLGKGIVDGFGQILSGGLASVINMGVQLAVEGIAKIGKIIGGLFQSEETKKVNKPRDAFFAQFGGYDGLAKQLTEALVEQGVGDAGNAADNLIKQLYSADTESNFHSAEDAILDVFKASGLDFKKMAMGGSGRVTRPTMFYSAGDEDYSFSGEGRRFGGSSDKSLELLTDIRRLLKDQARAIAVAASDARALA